jgi:hypothetical protein
LKPQLTLTVFLELSSGEHAFAIEACDVNGNSAILSTHFIVEGEFDLLSLANTQSICRTDDHRLLSDRHRRTIDLAIFYGFPAGGFGRTRCAKRPAISNWMGRPGRDGQPVANGLLFAFHSRHGEKKIERIEKMARLQ